MKKNICCFLISLFLLNNIAFAGLPFSGKDFIQSGGKAMTIGDVTKIVIFDKNGGPSAELVEQVDKGLKDGLPPILEMLWMVGAGVAFCVLMYMGIQFVIAPPAKKAELKAGITPYLIGLLLLVAGVPIATIIINIFIQII